VEYFDEAVVGSSLIPLVAFDRSSGWGRLLGES